MKPKHVAMLAGVIVILLVLRFLAGRSGGDVASDLGDVGLARLLPETLESASVQWIEARGPSSDDGAAALRVERRGDAWVVQSAQEAPAESDRVDDFLEGLLRLRGEVRGTSAAAWADFGVDEATAPVIVLGGEGGEALATLHVGQAGDGPGTVFLRVDDDERVHHGRSELRSQLALYGGGTAPSPDHWVRKQLLDLAADDVVRLVVERPDARWIVARRDEPAGEEGEEDAASAEDPWRLDEPSWPWEARPMSLGGFVTRAGGLRVTSVLDADAEPACALEGPVTTVRLETTDGATHGYRLGGKIDSAEEVAVRVDGDRRCYGLSRWSAQSLLPRASTAADLPDAFEDAPDAADVTRVALSVAGEEEIVLMRGDDESWSVRGSSETGVATRVSRLVNALLLLRLDDLARAGSIPAEAREVHATVEVRTDDRRLAVELLGGRVGAADGARYFRVPAGRGGIDVPDGWVGVAADSAVTSLLAPREELVEASGT